MPPKPPRSDVALAIVAAIALIAGGLIRKDGEVPVVGYVLAALACAPLAWRRTAPLAVLLAAFAGVLACLPVLHPYDTAVFVVMVALYTVAVEGGRRRSIVVGIGTACVLVGVIVLIEHREGVAGEIVLRLVLALGALVVGDTVRTRRALATAHRERTETESRRRVQAERLRIARELHDTLGHALVAINVRSGVAAHLGGDATGALTDIKTVSAEALRDLRATLTLLRDEEDGTPTHPTQDLTAVPQLVERARAAGLDAAATIQLNGTAVSSAVGQAAFRIVQESLTNILRHADASKADIDVRVVGEGVKIDVSDDGRGSSAPPGHGLQGMAERAHALGGQVSAGPRAGGGWRVTARLPIDDP